MARAESEYDRFAVRRAELASPVEQDFEEAIREVQQIEKKLRLPRARPGNRSRKR